MPSQHPFLARGIGDCMFLVLHGSLHGFGALAGFGLASTYAGVAAETRFLRRNNARFGEGRQPAGGRAVSLWAGDGSLLTWVLGTLAWSDCPFM